MKIENTVALVTGANRGIGSEFVRQLRDRGAAKVYATTRKPGTPALPGVEPVLLDVTDHARIRAVAAQAVDVELLVNNAGIASGADLLSGDVDAIRQELETNLFGVLELTRAFAPVLARNGGGAVLNVLSAASWSTAPGAGSYAMSKAATWSLTNATRVELAAQGTQVLALHMAMVDTDMTAAIDVPKATPGDVVAQALDGLEAGAEEVLADELTRQLKAGLGAVPGARHAA